MIIIGVDTGGTFTDFTYRDGDRWKVYKLPSTPENPARAVIEGLRHIAGDAAMQIIHGSTVATNAILERKGVRTILITNRGFEDVIEIGRQNRTRLYDLLYRKEPQLVPEELRFGIGGRVLCTGEVLEEPDPDDALQLMEMLRPVGAESIAVCLLFSYMNPNHEIQLQEILNQLDLPISLSHQVVSEFREFERMSTTVINAYVSPKMRSYIAHLTDSLGSADTLRIMQSNGGSISAATAMTESVRTILSGPAGGAVGSLEIGKLAGFSKLITIDMGGTSTDVSLIDGKISLTLESSICSYPLRVPMIDIHTVGAGGGSVVRLDAGGSLKVGPESAGADPGPICYGKGEQITVTDANLYLGRLVPEHFLGGAMRILPERLDAYFDRMAHHTGLSAVELAEGILSVVNSTMERAIRVISVERGYDPREFTLLAFGGAGGMHAAFLAGLLNIPRILIPVNPGALSAIGMLTADVLKDYSQTVMLGEGDTNGEQLLKLFQPFENRGRADLIKEGVCESAISFERFLDMRYQGQSYEILVPFDAGKESLAAHFHHLHQKMYGYRNERRSVEIVNLRLRVRGVPEKLRFEKLQKAADLFPERALLGERQVVWDSVRLKTPVFARGKLLCGNRVTGPAIIVEYSSTIVIPPGATGVVDEYGNLLLQFDP